MSHVEIGKNHVGLKERKKESSVKTHFEKFPLGEKNYDWFILKSCHLEKKVTIDSYRKVSLGEKRLRLIPFENFSLGEKGYDWFIKKNFALGEKRLQLIHWEKFALGGKGCDWFLYKCLHL